MAGNKCSYFQCGKSVRADPTLRKFSFPVTQMERCQTASNNIRKSKYQQVNITQFSEKIY